MRIEDAEDAGQSFGSETPHFPSGEESKAGLVEQIDPTAKPASYAGLICWIVSRSRCRWKVI